MLSKIHSYGLQGIEGFTVEVEVDITPGLPKFEMVGLADTAIKEAKERVRSAIRNSGYNYPVKRITVNLAPADVKKEGPLYDLAIAIGVMCADDKDGVKGLTSERARNFVVIGELSLNGEVKGVRGVLPILISARKAGCKNFIIPAANSSEASFIEGVIVYGININAFNKACLT